MKKLVFIILASSLSMNGSAQEIQSGTMSQHPSDGKQAEFEGSRDEFR